MARWQVHGRDSNAKTIIAALEARGASVTAIDRPVDILIGFSGLSAVAEIKTIRGNLRATQTKFLAEFKGLARVLRTVADVDELIAYMTEITRRCRRG